MRMNKLAAVATMAATLLGVGAMGAKALVVDADAAVVAVADVEVLLDELGIDIFDLVGDAEAGVDALLEEIQDLEVAEIREAAVDTTVVVVAGVQAEIEADVELLVELIDDLDVDGLVELIAEEALDRVETVTGAVEDLDELVEVDAAAAVLAFVGLF